MAKPSPDANYRKILGGSLSAAVRELAPPELYLRGDADLLYGQHRRAAVIGSREASAEGIARAEALAKQLVQAGVVVVSGLAKGIDAAAHRTAIDAGGRTIAVLGTSLDEVKPPEHAGLQAKIGRDHLLVSQWAKNVGPKGFAKRNATMAMWSDVTFVVEAGPRSGARHQVEAMLQLNRPVYIHEVVRQALGTGDHWVDRALRSGASLYSEDGVGDLISTIQNCSLF